MAKRKNVSRRQPAKSIVRSVRKTKYWTIVTYKNGTVARYSKGKPSVKLRKVSVSRKRKD